MTNAQDTIFAPASAAGRAGVAIIRVSGPEATTCLGALSVATPAPRVATLATLTSPHTSEIVDKALVLFFNAPHSFTGENIVEFHIHGSTAIKNELLDILGSLENFRMAEPGEFSRRALYNNKMDLAETEGLADLIESETSLQKRQAMRQMEGALSVKSHTLREATIKARAQIEALLDFPDDEIPDELISEVTSDVSDIKTDINALLDNALTSEKIREGIYITIIGAPNAGKSTLLNSLARRDAAIVSDIAGTTRDIVDISLNINGYSVILADTAGIHDTNDSIELEGIRRAKERAENSDIQIHLYDGSTLTSAPMVNDNAINVINKKDLVTKMLLRELHQKNILCISAQDGDSIDVLITTLVKHIEASYSMNDNSLITRTRHKVAFENALQHLTHFEHHLTLDLKAEELRRAAIEIGKITGNIHLEDVLDALFSSFCIGK